MARRASHSKRKHSRKTRSKHSRKVRRSHSRKQRGGYNPGALNLTQGQQYLNTHMRQHGGGSLVGAPLGDSGMLPQDLRIAARVGPLDSALGEIAGMSDTAPAAPTQSGGRRSTRRSKGRKGTKGRKGRKSAKGRKSTKGRKGRKGSRRQRGGALTGAPYNANPMLLSPAMAAKAGTADFSNPLLKY
jgi:hypothetical protein